MPLYVVLNRTLMKISASIYLNALVLQGVQEADREEEGFYIRSGITIISEKATIEDGTVI
jgi:hypothetical protein